MASLRFRKFTNPDALLSVAPQRLIRFLRPWHVFLSGKGLELGAEGLREPDYERLAQVLVTPDASMPREMIDALYYVHETSSDEDMIALLDLARDRRIEIERDPATTAADVAIQMWLVAPDVLMERHAETVAFRQQSFLYYASRKRERRYFPTVDDALRVCLESALDDWFEEHRRGRGCRVFFFRQGGKVSILVRHGQAFRREPSHGEDGKTHAEIYRPQKHDVLVYDPEGDELAVHAETKGEIKLYLGSIGELLFGDPGHFPAAEKFTLDPLVRIGADSLLSEDIDGIEEARLVEYRLYWGGAYKEMEIRRADDLFAARRARGRDRIPANGRLVAAVFKVKFEDSDKERSVTIRPPGSARYERNEDSEVIEDWLRRRGFVRGPQREEEDDEVPTALLESA